MQKIRIRPSSLSTVINCSRCWYRTYIMGETSPNNIRAMLGTGVHAGAEQFWNEAISKNDKSVANLNAMNDAAIEAFDTELKNAEHGVDRSDGTDDNTARSLILQGNKAFLEDIVPFTAIPKAVEKRLTLSLDHPVVADLSGTVDYLGMDNIADIKTSKRKIVTSNHVIQQSIYKLLAESNGMKIEDNLIQGIVFSKSGVVGSIEKMETDIIMVKAIVNNLLDRLEALVNGIDPNILFPANPQYHFCRDANCASRMLPEFDGIDGLELVGRTNYSKFPNQELKTKEAFEWVSKNISGCDYPYGMSKYIEKAGYQLQPIQVTKYLKGEARMTKKTAKIMQQVFGITITDVYIPKGRKVDNWQ